MVGAVRKATIDTPTARARLKRGRQAHWQPVQGRGLKHVHIGYQRWKGEAAGRWLMRRYLGIKHSASGKPVPRYNTTPLGLADDARDSNDKHVLSFEQATDLIRDKLAAPDDAKTPDPATYTVWEAWLDYAAHLRATGKEPDDSRARCHIKPALGLLTIASELTTRVLRDWLSRLAKDAAQVRSKAGKPQYRAKPETEDEIRARRASANRVFTMLRAALNHAYKEGHVKSRDAWERVEPFEGVETARLRYLTLAEAKRLLNACDADFRSLVRAGLETGARYSELGRLRVEDFDPDASTLAIHKSKSLKPRHILLTPEAVAFFKHHCAGRSGRMFTRADGTPWQKNDQTRPMQDAVKQATITPPCGFHTTRHTWASHAVMNGMPLMLVAKNLGHKDTRMVEKHYGHLAPDWSAKIIRETAPRYDMPTGKTVTPIR